MSDVDLVSVTVLPPLPTTPASGRTDVFLRYLEYLRDRVVAKVSVLAEEEARHSRLPSGWTPLELLQHLGHVELRWVEWGFLGHAVADPWGDRRGDRWYVGAEKTRDELVAELRARGANTRRVLEDYPLTAIGEPSPRWDGEDPPSLERVLFHLLQEYARHLGHLDVVVELAGGPTGQ